ncbi:MAG: alcohol dehydrogenase catalytic domain-containing protein [Victivallales bacterium]
MKAAFRKKGKYYIKDLERRKLGLGQIRVAVDACGICGTDIHSDSEQEEMFGHEIAGRIIETGEGVNWLKAGQKIVLDSATPCGKCDNCKNTKQELCTDIQSIWFVPSFGFAEEIIAPAVCAISCEDIEPAVASLQEPLGVAIDLVRLADIRPESNVLVMGPGPIGLMALALVKRMGARRVFMSAFKKEKIRCEMAKKLGADEVIDPSECELTDKSFGCQIDRILVTTPPPTLNDAFKVAAKGGIVSFIGIGHGERAFCKFDANAFHFKKLQLRASFASPALYGPLALQYLREGVIDGKSLVSHRFPLEKIEEAMKVASDPAISLKVVVTSK